MSCEIGDMRLSTCPEEGCAAVLKTRFGELTVALQPIVEIHTGQCFGHEVLLRNHEALGAGSIKALLDACDAEASLLELEAAVRSRAAQALRDLPGEQGLRLFFNLDARLAGDAAAILRQMEALAAALPDREVRFVTEVASSPAGDLGTGWLKSLRGGRCGVAIDAFRADGGGLLLLCDAEPDFIKIDRLYVRRIDEDARRRLLLSQIVATAHLLGIAVIAVGVETEREFLVCREVGCDLVQGHFVAPPTTDPASLKASYEHVAAVVRRDRRRRPGDQKWIREQLNPIAPVAVDTPMAEVFSRFAEHPDQTFLPVVDHAGQPLGILREASLKHYAYSTFGRELINNRGIGRRLRDFLSRCPVADLATPLNHIMAIYSADERGDGIMVTENLRYIGFLSARSIIRAMHERSVAAARDENPLTKLPGNAMINDYISASLAEADGRVFVYVDFDNFKPFNDTYGFRQGDRAITLFAELMRRAARADWFLGHIGGDDFFIGMRSSDVDAAAQAIRRLVQQFAADACSFYDAKARERGFITAKDRDRVVQRFPLLSASAVLLPIPPDCRTATVDEVSAAIAALKKAVKAAPDKLAVAALPCC